MSREELVAVSELKPCPFCGGRPELKEWRKSKFVTENGHECPEVWFIGCPNKCWFDGPRAFHQTKEGVITKWNTRYCERESGDEPLKLRTALEMLYDKWENGDPVHELDDGEPTGSYMGLCFTLTEEEENSILSLIGSDELKANIKRNEIEGGE